MPVMTPSWGMDRLFEDFFSDFPFGNTGQGVFPAWNVAEDEKSFRVEAEVPGFSHDNLEISVVGDELRLSGKREHETKDEKSSFHRRERFTGEFSRALRFGTPIQSDKVEATFKDGVLTVILPKAEVALPRKISVKAA
jgi:HSP20 family protein